MKKTIALGIVFLFVVMSFASIPGIQLNNQSIRNSGRGDILYVGGNGTGNYTTIQSAIDDASDGDTVFVYDDSSPYYESITIENSINLIGEDKNTTIIEGFENGRDGIGIYSDFVNVTGFTTRKFKWNIASGVHIYRKNYCNIVDNIFNDNSYGVRICESNYNNISKNIIFSNYEGILLENGCDYNNIVENKIYKNSRVGIDLSGYLTNISYNIIEDNGGMGIEVLGDDNIFYGNIIKNHTYEGLNFWDSNRNLISNNYLLNNDYGIYMWTTYGYDDYCVYCTIKENVISNCKYDGINIDGIGHRVFKNTITDCNVGIFISALDSDFFWNNIIKNDKGILISLISSDNNNILHNNFINNKRDASSTLFPRGNIWDGNYWDKWIGIRIPIPIFQKLPKIIIGLGITFDWHPSKEPYNYTTTQGCGIE